MSSTEPSRHRPLADSEIQTLRGQGCTADDWRRVQVTEPFLAPRVVDAHFSGDILIGALSGDLSDADGLAKPAGIYRAQLIDCQLADHVRIASVAGHIARYRICKDVLQHLSNQAVRQFLDGNLRRCRHALLTNDRSIEQIEHRGGERVLVPLAEPNSDMVDGGVRPLRLTEPPFSLDAQLLGRIAMEIDSTLFVKEVLLWSA